QAQPDDLFGSFDENPQLLFEDVATDDTSIQMETTDNTVDELPTRETSLDINFGETSDLGSPQAQPDDLFSSFDENTEDNSQLLFETVIQEDVETNLWDLGETSEVALVSERENNIIAPTEELATTETIEVIAPEDEFADLAA
ncbi:MAG: hypothetical protein ACYT04_74365, partial [Nostoc sp.]